MYSLDTKSQNVIGGQHRSAEFRSFATEPMPPLPSKTSQQTSLRVHHVPPLTDTALSRRAALGLLAASPFSTHLQAALAATAAEPAATLCDTSVVCLRSARGQDITLVGTAHISADSALLVQRVLRQVTWLGLGLGR